MTVDLNARTVCIPFTTSVSLSVKCGKRCLNPLPQVCLIADLAD